MSHIVSCSQFSGAQTEQIFERLIEKRQLVVCNESAPIAVLLSPEEYVRLMDELNDARLLAVASERMAHYDPSKLISEEEMNCRLGVTEDDLKDFESVEIE